MNTISLRVGLAGLGTAGRSVIQAISKVRGFVFAAGADTRKEFYDAVVRDRAVPHDGRWGKATLEVCLAILKSSQERREVHLSHQIPSPY